jgi:hypothetical protein
MEADWSGILAIERSVDKEGLSRAA